MAEFSVVGLRVLREVARRGSLTAAAQRLGYTQSAISRQVALMEAAAGRALFERHARGVSLTEAGRVVLRRAEDVLAGLEATRQELEDLAARPRGRVRVGGFSSALAAVVPRAIAAFSAREPTTEVVVREGSSQGLIARAADGRVDVAVVITSEDMPDGVEVADLFHDPLLIAVGHDHRLAARTSIPLDALRDERWIAASTDPRSSLLGAWTYSSWKPNIAYVARDWTAKLGLVAAGLGITVLPGLAVPALPPTLAVVRIDDPAATRATAIVRPTRSTPDHSDSLSDALCESLRDAAAEAAAAMRRHLRGHSAERRHR